MNKIIELSDGVEVEIDVNENDIMEISNGSPIESSMEKVEELLSSVITPINNAFSTFNEKIDIESAKVTVGVKFGATGNVFIAKSSVEANLSIELTIKAK